MIEYSFLFLIIFLNGIEFDGVEWLNYKVVLEVEKVHSVLISSSNLAIPISVPVIFSDQR